jgi:hypothetical protein
MPHSLTLEAAFLASGHSNGVPSCLSAHENEVGKLGSAPLTVNPWYARSTPDQRDNYSAVLSRLRMRRRSGLIYGKDTGMLLMSDESVAR